MNRNENHQRNNQTYSRTTAALIIILRASCATGEDPYVPTNRANPL